MFDIYILYTILYLAMESVENCVQAIKDHFHASVTFLVAFLSRSDFLKKKKLSIICHDIIHNGKSHQTNFLCCF